MKTIKNFYTIHTVFMSLMAAALLSGIVFFLTNNLDFLIDAINYGKFSLPNIAYWLAKTVCSIVIPLVFLMPSTFEFGRIKTVKFTFILYGILELLTLTWIFYFIGHNPFSELFSTGAGAEFQKAGSFVASYVSWDTYSWIGSLSTLIFGVLCIFTGISFDDNKKKVRTLVLALLLIRILFPIISNLISANGVLSTFWITNNYSDILSFVFVTAALFFASGHDLTWVSLIWDQELQAAEKTEE